MARQTRAAGESDGFPNGRGKIAAILWGWITVPCSTCSRQNCSRCRKEKLQFFMSFSLANRSRLTPILHRFWHVSQSRAHAFLTLGSVETYYGARQRSTWSGHSSKEAGATTVVHPSLSMPTGHIPNQTTRQLRT